MIYLWLFIEFFKVGLFTFGGGYAMIPLIQELVLERGWLSDTQFYSFIGVCESTPGPIAVNMATYIGSVQGGLIGSIVATLGVVMPSFIIILLIATVIKSFTDNRFFKGFIKGVKPVIVALILSTGIILLAKELGIQAGQKVNFSALSAVIFAIIVSVYFAVKLIFKKKLSAISIILISAALGIGLSVIA